MIYACFLLFLDLIENFVSIRLMKDKLIYGKKEYLLLRFFSYQLLGHLFSLLHGPSIKNVVIY